MRSQHQQTGLHWLAQDPDSGQPGAKITPCGKDIDGPCDRHQGTGCQYGLAWTRSRDLDSYRSRPYESWPPPCPVCKKAATAAVVPC